MPNHMAGPEWYGWEALATPSPIEWVSHTLAGSPRCSAQISSHIVATVSERPHYCDRGHFMVNCWLPYIDGADGLPRYYMSRDAAVSETEAFLRWRLWRQR